MSPRYPAISRWDLRHLPGRLCTSLLTAILFVLAVACAVACSVSASAATYYVSPSGSDSNSGASSAPFLTIQKAANLVKAGDTVIVRQGAYAGFVLSWDTPTAGTASARITFQADPTAPAGSVVINKGNNKTHVGIDLEPGSAYITIDGFVVDGSGGIANYPTRGSGIKASGDYDIVRNCIVKNIDYGFGIFTGDTAGVIIQNNEVYNISWGSAQNGLFGHGMYVSGNCTGTQVRGNRIHDNLYIGIHVNGDIGSSGAPGLVQGVVIENNLVYNNGQNALNCDGIQSSTIRNNLFYGYQNYGVCLYQIDAGGPCKNNLFANNTFVATRSGSAAALRFKDGATGNTVLNNILLGGDGTTYRISNDSLPGLVSDYNVVTNAFQSEDTSSTELLDQWRSSTSQDKHSITATLASLFVNPGANDFHLLPTSPALDKGTAVAQVTSDLDGKSRPSGAADDIGAFELLVPTNVTAKVAVTRGGLVYNRATGQFLQQIAIKNISAQTLTGPISVALDNLSPNATLSNRASTTVAASPAGSPYVSLAVGGVAAGATVTVTLVFSNPLQRAISYAVRVLSGPGTR